MFKKPVAYECCITMNDISEFLSKLGCKLSDNDHYFFKVGCWGNVENTYADNIPYKSVREYAGLGILRNVDDHFPVVVMDFDKQTVTILDKELVQGFNERIKRQNIETLILTFERAFSSNFSVTSLIEDATKPVSLFDGD